MQDVSELVKTVLATAIGTGIGILVVPRILAKLPRIRFERRGGPTPPPPAQTPQGDPKAPQIHPLFNALAKAMQLKYEAAAKKVQFNDPNKLGNVELREVVLTKEMQERGPVPDVPAIRWTDDAIGQWLSRQSFKTWYPVHVFQHPNGNLLFSQPMRPEEVYGHVEPPR